jgi:hypothetical protein
VNRSLSRRSFFQPAVDEPGPLSKEGPAGSKKLGPLLGALLVDHPGDVRERLGRVVELASSVFVSLGAVLESSACAASVRLSTSPFAPASLLDFLLHLSLGHRSGANAPDTIALGPFVREGRSRDEAAANS